MKQKSRSRRRRSSTKSVLRLPDLEHAKAAVLNSLNSADASGVIVTPSMSSLTGIARNRAWPSTGSWSCVIALISNPVNLRPARLTYVLVLYAGLPTRQPFLSKRPNATLAASRGFDQPSMIALASSRTLDVPPPVAEVCRQLAQNLVFTLHRTRLHRYRGSNCATFERRVGCFFKDANCFEPCHLLSGRASSGAGTNSASLRRQPYSQRSPLPLRGPLCAMRSPEERKWKK